MRVKYCVEYLLLLCAKQLTCFMLGGFDPELRDRILHILLWCEKMPDIFAHARERNTCELCAKFGLRTHSMRFSFQNNFFWGDCCLARGELRSVMKHSVLSVSRCNSSEIVFFFDCYPASVDSILSY